MHDVVIKEFIEYIGGENIRDVSVAISATDNPKWIYFFILKLMESNIKDIFNASLEKLDGSALVLDSLNDIKTADITFLVDSLINIGDAEYIYKYAKNVQNKLFDILKKYLDKNHDELVKGIENLDIIKELYPYTQQLSQSYSSNHSCSRSDAEPEPRRRVPTSQQPG